MGWYGDHVIPRLGASALDRPDVAVLRDGVCAALSGEVVEIGFGSGLNVGHYPAGVRVYAVEPSRVARKLAGPRVAAAAAHISFEGDDAQRLPFGDGSLDGALVTFALCAIADPVTAAAELHRVLVPGGTVSYLEHGSSPHLDVQRWQRRLNGLNLTLSGCRLDRVAPDILIDAGLELTSSKEHYLAGVPRFSGYLYQGTARKVA